MLPIAKIRIFVTNPETFQTARAGNDGAVDVGHHILHDSTNIFGVSPLLELVRVGPFEVGVKMLEQGGQSSVEDSLEVPTVYTKQKTQKMFGVVLS